MNKTIIYDNPELIYDGTEPKQIKYHMKMDHKIVLDLVKSSDYSVRNKINKEILNKLINIFNLNQEIILDKLRPVIEINGEIVCVYFSSVKNIYICYVLYESQPGRYQCYIVGETSNE